MCLNHPELVPKHPTHHYHGVQIELITFLANLISVSKSIRALRLDVRQKKELLVL